MLEDSALPDTINMKIRRTLKIRKKADVDKMMESRQARIEEKRDSEDNWYRHWDKKDDEQNPSTPKSKGGGRRPRFFKTDFQKD